MLKKIAGGYSWLVVVEGLNNIVPLVVVPYLTRVLGLPAYGKTVLGMAVFSYLVILCDFGFSLHGVSRIAQANELDRPKILFAITAWKMILASIAFLICFVVVSLVCTRKEEYLLYLGTFVGVYGQGMFPTWFLQGVGKIKEGALIMMSTRAMYFLLIFSLIRAPRDYFLVNFCFSTSSIVAVVGAYAMILKSYPIRRTGIQDVLLEAKSSLPVFVTLAGTSLYRNANALILGMFGTPAVVANYSISEKMTKAIQGMVNPAAQAIYPYHAKAVVAGDQTSSSLRGIYGLCFLSLLVIAVVAVYVCAPLGIKLFAGKAYPDMIFNLRILSVVILFGGISYWIGLLNFLSCGRSREFAILTNAMGAVSVLATLLMVPFFGGRGAIYSMIMSELGLMLLMIWRSGFHAPR